MSFFGIMCGATAWRDGENRDIQPAGADIPCGYEITLLVLIYCAAHIPLILTTGEFYDDFVLNHGDVRLNMDLLWSEGRPLYGYVDNLLLAAGSQFFVRTLTFLSYLASGLLLREILKTVVVIEPEARFFIVAFTMVFPADSTRVLLILVYYALSYFLFFVAFYLLCLYLQSRKVWLRAVSLCLFFLSFGHMSLLGLFLLVILYIGYSERTRLGTLPGLRSVILGYGDFLILPLLFWIMSALAFPPQGSHKEYFWIHLTNFSPVCWAVSLRGAFLRPLAYSFYPVSWVYASLIAAATVLLYGTLTKHVPEPLGDLRTTAALFGVGVVALFAALVPYVAINKLPEFWDWSPRHAMLVPLGAGFLLYYCMRLLDGLFGLKHQIILGACVLLVCVFSAATSRTYLTYWNDWYKCLAIMEQFRSSEPMRTNTSFLFRDNAEEWDAKRRNHRFYELSGLMKFAFGDEKRFGTLEDSWTDPDCLKLITELLKTGEDARVIPNIARSYSLSDWDSKAPEVLVRIKPLQQVPGLAGLLRLKFEEFFDPKSFQKEVAHFIGLEYSNLPPQAACGPSNQTLGTATPNHGR